MHNFAGLEHAGTKGAELIVFTKVKGEDWRIRDDWSSKYQHPFCLDMKAERLEEMVVILGNSDWQASSPIDLTGLNAPKITATNIGCWKLAGRVTALTEVNSGNEVSKTTITTDMVFEARDPLGANPPFNEDNSFRGRFYLSKGNGTWTHVGRVGPCTANKTGNFTLDPQMMARAGQNVLGIYPYEATGPLARVYSTTIIKDFMNFGDWRVEYTCPPGRGRVERIVGPILWMTPKPMTRVRDDGILAEDAQGGAGAQSRYRWSWRFQPQRER